MTYSEYDSKTDVITYKVGDDGIIKGKIYIKPNGDTYTYTEKVKRSNNDGFYLNIGQSSASGGQKFEPIKKIEPFPNKYTDDYLFADTCE
jgi:hypothetical protein